MNYYRLHIGDYLRDTSHLSLLEHGVYTRLLQVYYTRESGIRDADKYRLIGARTEEERAAVDAVLSEFFRMVDSDWVQDRCEREIEAYQAKAEHNREVGKRGGRPRTVRELEKNPEETQTVSARNPNETLASSQEPIANSQEREREPRSPNGSRLPDGFPDAEAVDWCRQECPTLDLALVQAKFRDYWLGVPGARGRKVDWPATWRNFCRNEVPRAKASAGRPVAKSKGERWMEQLNEARRDRNAITI